MSSRPTVVVQLSDPHIGATWAEGDPMAGLATAVASIRRLRPAPDALALAAGDRAALADVVRDREKVMLIIAGHVHRAISGELAGRRVLSAPSTYIGFELDIAAERIDDVPTPPGYVVHLLRDGELASHVVSLPTRG